jgi:hypothetical protein
MFEKKYEDRLAAWRDFRETLEVHEDPLQSVMDFYDRAPRVSIQTDPWDQDTWPTPWELVNENQYCDFARVLGMCYSLQLTERFKGSIFEIHIGIDTSNSSLMYLLFVDDRVIGMGESYVHCSEIPETFLPQKIYPMPSIQ